MRWTFWIPCESLLKGRGLGKGGQSDPLVMGGWRMTRSAYNAMDVFEVCDSYSKGRGLGKGGQSDLLGWEAGG